MQNVKRARPDFISSEDDSDWEAPSVEEESEAEETDTEETEESDAEGTEEETDEEDLEEDSDDVDFVYVVTQNGAVVLQVEALVSVQYVTEAFLFTQVMAWYARERLGPNEFLSIEELAHRMNSELCVYLSERQGRVTAFYEPGEKFEVFYENYKLATYDSRHVGTEYEKEIQAFKDRWEASD